MLKYDDWSRWDIIRIGLRLFCLSVCGNHGDLLQKGNMFLRVYDLFLLTTNATTTKKLRNDPITYG